ncbi:MAG: hypothetical protein ABIF77_02210 [bacterium]
MHNRMKLVILVMAATLAGTACASEPVDWSGWYVGAFGGYLNGKLTSNDPGHFETTGEFEDNSPIAGIQAGLNKQSESGWVFGGELIIPLYLDKGTAVDTLFFPDADPKVIYEADHKWAILVGGKAGKPVGKMLVYLFGALGFANADGKTLNLDETNAYSPGSEQSANATHLVYQIGAGADTPVNGTVFMGIRVMAFNSNQQQYEMPWNEGENNNFGLNSLVVQVHGSRRF